MKVEMKIYDGKNKNILATANIITVEGIKIKGFKVIKSRIDDNPIFYPPSRTSSNNQSYNVISKKGAIWDEIEKVLSDEFEKKYPKFKKKLKIQTE